VLGRSDSSAGQQLSSPKGAGEKAWEPPQTAIGNLLAAGKIPPVKPSPARDEMKKGERPNLLHVFGPVPSRRLGRSLGVDLVPFKTCTYDCIYCQLGPTSHQTCEVREYVPVREVRKELEVALRGEVEADYVTLSGSGEPTLHSRIDEVIRTIKDLTSIPVAVLTNGSLLHRPRVRERIRQADLIIPSLDAGTEPLFRLVNRPHPSLSLEKLVTGLIRLREEFNGAYWLEVMLLGGISALDSEVSDIAEIVELIRPHRVQLNTVHRPPAQPFAYPVPKDKLVYFKSFFPGQVEVIEERTWCEKELSAFGSGDLILSLLRRRPCSLEDICAGLGLHRSEVAKHLEGLVRTGTVKIESVEGRAYFSLANGDGKAE
jgi:wyosine [tRNA(Phe)-imidazoG37] synthetase (radical SAM superfamily)